MGLDIGTSGVRAAELSNGKGGATLERFGQVALPPGAVRDGEVGESTLARYAVPERVARLVVPGVAPPKGERRTTFLGLPLTWIPSTWVFNRNGTLATAFNYGEATPAQLDAAIAGAASDWPH